jgi:hypothetical protein
MSPCNKSKIFILSLKLNILCALFGLGRITVTFTLFFGCDLLCWEAGFVIFYKIKKWKTLSRSQNNLSTSDNNVGLSVSVLNWTCNACARIQNFCCWKFFLMALDQNYM